MSDDVLRLRRLEVRRAPGIDDGGFVVDGLVDGVNVIFGPNGSGKTTTASAIEALLWPAAAAAARASLAARFEFGGASWHASVDGGALRAQRDGHDAAPPAPPRADLRHRYRLHLHELILREHGGGDFAAEILRESAGGHDLPAAAARLAIVNPSPKGLAESRGLAAARAALDAVHATERALQRDVDRLGELDSRLAAARSARSRLGLVEGALEHARLRREHDEATAILATFDPRAAALVGDELTRLEELERQADDARRRAREADDARADAARRQLEALPGGPLPEALMPTLRAGLASLDAVRPQLAAAESALAAAAASCEEARRAIGDDVPESRLATLDLGALGDLARWAHDAGKLDADRLIVQRELEAIDDVTPPHSLDALVRGTAALEAWLAAPEAGGGTTGRWQMAASAILLLVAAAIVALLARGVTGWLAAAAVIAAAALFMLAAALRRPAGRGADIRADRAADYARLPLPQPAAWQAATVTTLLDDLRDQASATRDAARRGDRRAELERRLAALEPARQAIEERRSALIDRLGVAPAADAAAIAWMVERIGRWQTAHAALGAAREALAVLRGRQTVARDSLTGALAPIGAPEQAGDADLAGAVEALAQRERDHDVATHALRMADHQRAAAAAELARLAADRAALLGRVGITDDVALLAGWTASLPAHREAREREALAAAKLGDARRTLRSMPDFTDRLLDASLPELEAERDGVLEDAARLESLVEEASAIRGDVQRARAGRDVADALARVQGEERALRDACERDVEAAVGAALVGFLQEETRDQQLPDVFIRARQLFLRITNGAWRLDIGDGETPAFRAFHTVSGMGHALDELSTATRMQLLLAVRLAFVESQEKEQGGPRLPLLLDETLGTCDDARARAVMDSLLTLARDTAGGGGDGRQIFYFTAQWDEVEKWRSAVDDQAEGTEVPVAIHRLDAIRGAACPPMEPARRSPLARPALPAPDGLTHLEYGRALGVPAVARDAHSVHGAHLWHVVDDLPLLHRLLTLDVVTWGALESLVEYGGAPLLDAFPGAYPRIRAAARALAAAHRWARVGHGRPVHRQVLVDSGAISDRFIDAVSELAEQAGGAAPALLEQLESGQLKYFRASSAYQLRDYLVEHGYMDEESSLDRDEIAVRTTATVAAELDAGLLSPSQIERIVSSVLPSGVRGGTLPVAHPEPAGAVALAGPSDPH